MSIVIVFVLNPDLVYIYPSHDECNLNYLNLVMLDESVNRLRLKNNYILNFNGRIGVVWDDINHIHYHTQVVEEITRLVVTSNQPGKLTQIIDNFNQFPEFRKSFLPPHVALCIPRLENLETSASETRIILFVYILVLFFFMLASA